jgi:hypothetical protein
MFNATLSNIVPMSIQLLISDFVFSANKIDCENSENIVSNFENYLNDRILFIFASQEKPNFHILAYDHLLKTIRS